jgi:tetratricopeptide (TPR) repeat protein
MAAHERLDFRMTASTDRCPTGSPTLSLRPMLLLAAALLAGSPALAQVAAVRGAEPQGNPCGLIYTDHYGPYDYRTQRPSLKIVEDFHYTPRVEAGISGSTGPIGGDLNYTLKASPNHHRALNTMMRVLARNKTDAVRGMEWPADCYFDRAMRFKPDDTVVRAMFAQYLHSRGKTAEGIRQLDAATEVAGDSPLSQYNIGLVYLELGAHEQALRQAHRAMAMGLPRTELAEGLKKAGKWREPEAAAPAASAASAAPSASAPEAGTPAAAASR